MTTTVELPTIKVGNLHLAKGKAVAFPATTGVHLGRGFEQVQPQVARMRPARK